MAALNLVIHDTDPPPPPGPDRVKVSISSRRENPRKPESTFQICL